MPLKKMADDLPYDDFHPYQEDQHAQDGQQAHQDPYFQFSPLFRRSLNEQPDPQDNNNQGLCLQFLSMGILVMVLSSLTDFLIFTTIQSNLINCLTRILPKQPTNPRFSLLQIISLRLRETNSFHISTFRNNV
jgi:hypothetical protein